MLIIAPARVVCRLLGGPGRAPRKVVTTSRLPALLAPSQQPTNGAGVVLALAA
jgi:hypothetical protein